MTNEAEAELITFVGQLAQSVAVLSTGMKSLMAVVERKDREIQDLSLKVKDLTEKLPASSAYVPYKYGGEVGYFGIGPESSPYIISKPYTTYSGGAS